MKSLFEHINVLATLMPVLTVTGCFCVGSVLLSVARVTNCNRKRWGYPVSIRKWWCQQDLLIVAPGPGNYATLQ